MRYIIKVINRFLKSIVKGEVKQSALDSFFDTISFFFFYCISYGMASAGKMYGFSGDEEDSYKTQKIKNLNFENKYTKKYFIAGFTCLSTGADFLTMEIILSYLTLTITKSNVLSQEELLEIILVEKILKLIQQQNIDEYLIFAAQFCSANQCNKIDELFASLKQKSLPDQNQI